MEARGLWGRRVGVAWKEGNDEDDDLLKRDEGCDVRKEEVMVEEAMFVSVSVVSGVSEETTELDIYGWDLNKIGKFESTALGERVSRECMEDTWQLIIENQRC